MSVEAYQRAVARENKVWSPFVYSFPFNDGQSADRITIYGLYSGSYLNQHDYLQEVETVDLINLLNDYNEKIAELTSQEQVIVADIVSKRYLASIDKLIHDQKMVTKAIEIQTEDDTWTVKIAALASDQAALDTLSTRVISETEKTSARIAELESYIGVEAYNLSEVDIQIAEKAIESAKVDIEKLDASNAILRIQIDTVNAAMQLIDVDLQSARTKVDIANIDRDIVKIGLRVNDLTIEQAQTKIEEAQLPIAEARVTLAEAKSLETNKELDYYENVLPNQATTDFNNKMGLQDVRQLVRENELKQHKEEKELELSNRLALENQDITFANEDSTEQSILDAQRTSVMSHRTTLAWDKINAAIAVEETLAAANITTQLTHTIKAL